MEGEEGASNDDDAITGVKVAWDGKISTPRLASAGNF